MQTITILDYVTGTVFIRPVPEGMNEAEEVAQYYENELALHLTDCHWMLSTKIDLQA